MLAKILQFLKPKRRESEEQEFERDYEAKEAGLQAVLGTMFGYVGHAVIPYQVGGTVDMYYFPQPTGTAFATMELLEPDGSGPLPSPIGTYELLAFTKHAVGQPSTSEFDAIERRFCGIFTTIGRYSTQAVLKPHDTCEVPGPDGQPNRCLVFDSYGTFHVGTRTHGLLLCIEVHPSELSYAREFRTASLLQLLKAKGHYPFSDLDRSVVA